MKWFLYTRGTIPLHRIAMAKVAVHKLSSKLLGMPFFDVLYINQGKKLWWAWNEKEIVQLGNKILKACSNEKTKKQHFEKLKNYCQKAIKTAEKSIQTDIKKFTDKQLAKEYKILVDKIMPAHALLDPDVDAIDVVLEPFLQEKIKNWLSKEKRAGHLEVYKKLSVPLYTSYLNAREMAIIKAALKKKNAKQDIKKLFKQFWWTSLGWENLQPHTLEYFEHQIKNYKKNCDLKQKYSELRNFQKQTKKQRQKFLKRYYLPKEINYWLKVLDQYAQMHDLRKEMQVKTVYAQHRFLEELHCRKGYKIESLEWLWPTEIPKIILGKKLNLKEIKKRKQCVAVIVSKQSIKLISGKQAIKEKERQLNLDVQKVREIKGLGVTCGKITGIVKVCNGYQQALDKITANDVLVTGMTLPDYLPAMKKAKAIVTDEGGITCHAAIVSRELKKVCVVGTKIATRVLQDGDLIEVDANHGWIHKLK